MLCALAVSLTFITSACAFGQVLVPADSSEGVRWAAQELEKQTRDRHVACRVVDDDWLGHEGFQLRAEDARLVVEANEDAGLMYGLLDLARRARDGHELQAIETYRTRPAMQLRAVDHQLGMYLGNTYGNAWRGYAEHDTSADWWFHDEDYWRRTFRRLAREKMNGIVFIHGHIFPAFIDYSQGPYPEAAFLEPDQVKANQQALRTAIRLGDEYNVTLHWLNWNIWVAPGLAKAHDISLSGTDNDLTRDYTAWCVQQFYETFPGFGSIIAQCGEAPPGCAEFIERAIVRGLNRLSPHPPLIVWSWCANPPDVARIIDAYRGRTIVMNYLQYEQLFCDRADPRIGAFSRQLDGADMVALGGPKSSQVGFFWGSPHWAQTLMHTLHGDNNGRGIVVEVTDTPDRWLAERAFAHYAWQPQPTNSADLWLEAVADRYGDRDIAAPFLRAAESASKIVGRQLMLTHSQSGAFMLQMGLSLIQCLEMPSITSYIFENAVETDENGYLTPRMGKCWPSADFDWGERVIPIAQYAITRIDDAEDRDQKMRRWMAERAKRGFKPSLPHPTDTTPVQIADRLDELARNTLAAVRQLEAGLPVPRKSPELKRVIDLMRLTAALGRYLAAKDRAALAWESFRLTADPNYRREAIRHIDASIDRWHEYAGLFSRVHDGQMWAYVLCANHPRPWTQLDFWHNYKHQLWKIPDMTARWEKEAELIRSRLENSNPAELAEPLFDELRGLSPHARVVYRFDFEDPAGHSYTLVNTETARVQLTRAPELVINGEASLLADSRQSEADWTEFFRTVSQSAPLQPNATYQVALNYRVVDPGSQYGAPFGMAFRTPLGGMEHEKGDSRTWGGEKGVVRQRVMEGRLEDFTDYFLFLSIHGRAAIVVDDLRIAVIEPQ